MDERVEISDEWAIADAANADRRGALVCPDSIDNVQSVEHAVERVEEVLSSERFGNEACGTKTIRWDLARRLRVVDDEDALAVAADERPGVVGDGVPGEFRTGRQIHGEFGPGADLAREERLERTVEALVRHSPARVGHGDQYVWSATLVQASRRGRGRTDRGGLDGAGWGCLRRSTDRRPPRGRSSMVFMNVSWTMVATSASRSAMQHST